MTGDLGEDATTCALRQVEVAQVKEWSVFTAWEQTSCCKGESKIPAGARPASCGRGKGPHLGGRHRVHDLAGHWKRHEVRPPGPRQLLSPPACATPRECC